MALSTAFAFRKLEKNLKHTPRDKIFQVELDDANDKADNDNTDIWLALCFDFVIKMMNLEIWSNWNV